MAPFLLLALVIASAESAVLTEYPESELGIYTTTAIAVDGEPCAEIGMDVIRRGGFAVDAAIAGLLCNGLYNSHSMGIGGGFVMTIYQRDSMTTDTVIAKEQAPSYATTDMFDDNNMGAQEGPFAMAIPGEIKGYWEAKQKYGNPDITWASIFQPSIDMCRNGIYVDWSLASALSQKEQEILNDVGLSETFIDPSTGHVWQEGDTHTRNNLADTFERIALNGADEFYSLETAQNMMADLQAIGGLMTVDDLESYSTSWEPPVTFDIGRGLTLHSVGPPASGVIMGYIMNILQNFNIVPEDGDEPVHYQRVVEAFKWAFGERSKLGDPADPDITDIMAELVSNLTSTSFAYDTFTKIDDFSTVTDPAYYGSDYSIRSDHGTAHLSVLAPNGDAVSVTSTVNLFFGSKFMSPSTGVIFNDIMDDFSYPNMENYFGVEPSPNNYIKPGKRPVSSMCPAIIVDENGDVRSVTGAAGGTRITTSTPLALIRNIWQGINVKESIDMPRVYHQLLPMTVEHEEDQRQDVLDYLVSVGHNLTDIGHSAEVCAIDVNPDGFIYANADKRKAGGVDGY